MSVHIEDQAIMIGAGNALKTVSLNDIASGWVNHTSSDPMTEYLFDFAESFVSKGFPEADAFLLVRLVCAWGGLQGRNPRIVRESIFVHGRGLTWLANLLRDGRENSLKGEYERAIQDFDKIKGLGISFRSKILRFLCPDDAVVLDSIIRGKLGYKNSVRGYREFVTDCKKISDHLNIKLKRPDGHPWRATDVEMGIFMTVRN